MSTVPSKSSVKAERLFAFRATGGVAPDDAAVALLVLAEAEGVRWQPDARIAGGITEPSAIAELRRSNRSLEACRVGRRR